MRKVCSFLLVLMFFLSFSMPAISDEISDMAIDSIKRISDTAAKEINEICAAQEKAMEVKKELDNHIHDTSDTDNDLVAMVIDFKKKRSSRENEENDGEE